MNSLEPNVILNADDLGLSPEINKAIIHCLDIGLINSASLMTTTPGFEEAVDLIIRKKYSDCIGIHINLTEGKPMTNFINQKYLTQDGTWNKPVIESKTLYLNTETKNNFAKEIIAQIRIAEEKGIKPAHINSHHNVHTFPALFFLFLNICREAGYKLRIAQTNYGGNILKSAYRKYINFLLKKFGINFSDYFETLSSYQQRKIYFKNRRVEIMTHPSFDKNNVLTDHLDKDNARHIMDYLDKKQNKFS